MKHSALIIFPPPHILNPSVEAAGELHVVQLGEHAEQHFGGGDLREKDQ